MEKMDLHYYQYSIGSGIVQHGEMHSSLTEISFTTDITKTKSPFLKQIRRALTDQNINPILRKNIVRGIHLRDKIYTRIIDGINLPLKFIAKGYFNTDDIELGLEGSNINDWEGHFLNEEYYYFYETKDPFSQWYRCKFEIDNIVFTSAEQYMMHSKASMFNDIKIAQEILKTNDVREQKRLGRQVKNFDKNMWEKVAINIVYKGNKSKFLQNEDLKRLLLATKNKTLVEASPTDIVWGIGLDKSDERAKDMLTWNGTNWLGIALTELREEFSLNPMEAGFLTPEDYQQLIARKYE